MPISATGSPTEPARRDRGLTLIELVAVIAILAVLALPAMLRYGGGLFGDTPPVQRAAAQLQAELTRMRDRALFGQSRVGLSPRAEGWAWLAPVARAGGQDGAIAWTGTGNPAAFPGLALDWQIDGRPFRPDTDPQAAPAVVILPDGSARPFALRISDARGSVELLCSFAGWGELTCADR